MHAALICNTRWLDEELPMFRYLVVGLLDEGVRVIQVVPQGTGEEELSAFGQRLSWQDSTQPWLCRWRLRKLSRAIGDSGATVLHALDPQAWAGTLEIGKRLGLPAVLSVWSAQDILLAEKLITSELGSQRPAFCATTAPLGKALTRSLGQDALVQVILPGVHTTQAGENETRDEESFCAVITGNGTFDADYQAVFEAVQRVVRDRPMAQFFLEGQGHDQHTLWQAAKRFDLLANISLVPPRLTQRDLLVRADVLIQPQALGFARTLPLQMMARGKPVLARMDPWLDYLVPDQTGWLLEKSRADDWESLIRRVMQRPEEAYALGQSAKQWVAARHVAAKQVAQTIALYRRVTGEGYQFPQASAG